MLRNIKRNDVILRFITYYNVILRFISVPTRARPHLGGRPARGTHPKAVRTAPRAFPVLDPGPGCCPWSWMLSLVLDAVPGPGCCPWSWMLSLVLDAVPGPGCCPFLWRKPSSDLSAAEALRDWLGPCCPSVMPNLFSALSATQGLLTRWMGQVGDLLFPTAFFGLRGFQEGAVLARAHVRAISVLRFYSFRRRMSLNIKNKNTDIRTDSGLHPDRFRATPGQIPGIHGLAILECPSYGKLR
jgi:hypothetical protein